MLEGKRFIMNSKIKLSIKSKIIKMLINLEPWKIIVSYRYLAIAINPDTWLQGNRLSIPHFLLTIKSHFYSNILGKQAYYEWINRTVS